MALVTKIKVESQQADRKLKEFKGRLSELQSVAGKSTGALSSLESAIGMNLTSLTKMGAAFGAVAMATKVAKDAFMSMESNIDELGRTTESCKAAYDVFTNSLATGNWDGFIKRLTNAIKGARDLYDALDRLGSVKSNNQAAIAIVQQEIQRLRLEKKQGKDVDAVLQEKIDRLAELQNQAVTAGMSAGRETISTTLTNRGVPADRAAAIVEDILQNGQEAFDRYAAQYAELKAKGTTTVKKPLDLDSQYYDTDGRLVTYREEQEFNSNNLLKAEQVEYEIARVVTEGETKIQEGINTFAQAVQLATANKKEEIKGVGYVQEGATTTKEAKTDWNAVKSANKAREQYYIDLVKGEQEAYAQIEKCYEASVKLNGELEQVAVPGSMNALNMELKAANDALNECVIGSEEWAKALEWVRNVEGQISLANDGKQATQSWSAASGAISRVGSALQSIDDPAAKVAGIIAQAIASVASGAGKAMSAKDTTSSGWAWIGAAASITAEMITIISAIKSATEYHAAGGFVGNNGLARGTDTVPAMLTPGELVLNKSQQANLASHLSDNSRGGQVEFRIKDRELYGILSNYQNRQSNKL